MGSVPILCINVNITIDTMLKFDANAEASVNVDAQCERTFKAEIMQEKLTKKLSDFV